MKIKSIVALMAVVASCFQAGASVAQIPALPLMGGLDGGGIPSLEGIVNVAALPGVIPGLLEDVPRSLGRNSGALPGLISMGSELEPLDTLNTVIGIGSSLGTGALFSTVPVLEVAATDPMNIVSYLLGNGTILTQSGIVGTLPAIPLVTSPLGLGFGL
jgi:hypothetical protein